MIRSIALNAASTGPSPHAASCFVSTIFAIWWRAMNGLGDSYLIGMLLLLIIAIAMLIFKNKQGG